MGISGLLPFIKPITKKSKLKEFEGESLAIDAFILLHKASLINGEFEEEDGKRKLLTYLTKWLDMFEYFKVVPYFVLDGSQLKSKEVTNEARRKLRNSMKETAEKLKAKGKYAEAYDTLRKSRGVTPVMIEIFLNLLKERNIQFVVAPFEADAQLAYLAREKLVKGVVTEDSDLLVFGCPLVIFKLDSEGACEKVTGSDLFSHKKSPFLGMNLQQFREICVLSGCDYLPNIPSLGLKTSYKFYKELQTFEKVKDFIISTPKYKIPTTYWEDFKMANQTFLYQKIYCPNDKVMKNLNLLPEHEDCIGYLKLSQDPEDFAKFKRIISGECCPKTLVPYNFLPTPVPGILPPISNSLLRVTSNSIPPSSIQTYIDVKNKLVNNNTNNNINLISNLYKLKGKVNKSNTEEDKAKTPIEVVSPFFIKKSTDNIILINDNSEESSNLLNDILDNSIAIANNRKRVLEDDDY